MQDEYQQNTNHWEAEIISFRTQLKRRSTTNLRNHLTEELSSLYQDALKFVKAQTKLNILPQECPYILEELLDEDYLPPK